MGNTLVFVVASGTAPLRDVPYEFFFEMGGKTVELCSTSSCICADVQGIVSKIHPLVFARVSIVFFLCYQSGHIIIFLAKLFLHLSYLVAIESITPFTFATWFACYEQGHVGFIFSSIISIRSRVKVAEEGAFR